MSFLQTEIPSTQIPQMISVCRPARVTPMFVGKPGCAKTAMVRVTAKRLTEQLRHELHDQSINVVTRELHLASMSEVDIRGYLVPDGDHAKFTKPEFWRVVEENPYGILFLDEFAQAPHEVQKAVAPLIYEGTIGEYKLPAGWTIVLAGNGTEDNAGANSLLSHVLNRIAYIKVTSPDIDEWTIWATGEKLPPEIITFAKLRPQIVFESEIPDAEDTPYCTPRQVEAIGRMAMNYPTGINGMISEPVGMALLAGTIGEGACAELAGIVRNAAKLPPFEEMMGEPQKCRVPSELDEQYAAAMLIAVRANPTQHMESAFQYMMRLPQNIAIVGIVSLVNRELKFYDSKTLMGWVSTNKELLGKFSNYMKLR